MRLLERTDKSRINEFLVSEEIHCNCKNADCNFSMVAPSTIDSFYHTRVDFGEPIMISSWYRCMVHNRASGGVDYSFHMKGLACDLTYDRGVRGELEIIDEKRLDRLERIARLHFDVVIRYKSFVHCHNME